ncbi:MAG: hypothetical protein ACYC27_10585 [Armatimonadota bacterium]
MQYGIDSTGKSKDSFFTLKLPSKPILMIFAVLAAIYACMYCVDLCKPVLTFEFVPMGGIDTKIVEKIAKYTAHQMNVKYRVVEPVPMPENAYNPMRQQYSADMLKDYLHTLPQKRNVYRLGITDKDIASNGVRFLFALSDRYERTRTTGVMSICRMYPSDIEVRLFIVHNKQSVTVASTTLSRDKLLYDLSTKMAVHQFGHLMALGDCTVNECVMNYSDSLRDLNKTKSDFCSICRAHIESQRHPE